MTQPSTPLRKLARGGGIPLVIVVIGMIVFGIVSNNPALIQGALFGLLSVCVMLAIEVPLILLALRRLHVRRLRSSPAGTLFVAPATSEMLVRPAGGTPESSPAPGALTRRLGQKRGTLRVGAAGATFNRDRHGGTEMTLSRPEMAEVTVTLHTPMIANVHVLAHSGQVVV